MNRPPFRHECRSCGKRREDDERFTWTGQHVECGIARMDENVRGLATKSGPAWHRWRTAMAACVGGVLTSDVPNDG